MEWISVTDRLPENNFDVLACLKDKTILMGRYTAHGGKYWKLYFSDTGLQYDTYRSSQVTHWIQLPEPPKSNG